jgi:hypothetical protein
MEKIMWATHKVQDAVNFWGKDEIPRRMAVKAHQEVIAAIVTQKYAGRYVPYGTTPGSERYKKWKLIYGSGSGKSAYWQLWGNLLRNITFWKERFGGTHHGWMAGIPKGAMDTGGKSWFTTLGSVKGVAKPIAFYARVLEFGGRFGVGGTHHPRPVFTYVLKDFDTTPFTSFLAAKILGGWH